MAYAGTTSTSPNVPWLYSEAIIGPSDWKYRSTHSQAEAAAAGFITDAAALRMSLGDSVLVFGSTTYLMSQHIVNALSSTGATLSAGLLVSSAS